MATRIYDEKCSQLLTVKLTPKQYERLRLKAKKAGLSIAEYIRRKTEIVKHEAA